jgi:hypothetical protein
MQRRDHALLLRILKSNSPRRTGNIGMHPPIHSFVLERME